jgi:P-type Mg2+ transporter
MGALPNHRVQLAHGAESALSTATVAGEDLPQRRVVSRKPRLSSCQGRPNGTHHRARLKVDVRSLGTNRAVKPEAAGHSRYGPLSPALAYQAEHGAIFARVSPEQKSRVILGLKARGHVVGYSGDGINDAPSLHTAGIGISVMNGVDVAKDAAKIILLEKDLAVLNEGVIEGRRCYANIMKYIVMSTSSNFGNMFSMAGAPVFPPFQPMLPTQILLSNFLYDISQVAVSGGNVDPAPLCKPKRWQTAFIRQFMMIIGLISSLYDFLTFGVLLWLFHVATNAPLFRTGWFVESVATQTLIVFVIRTARIRSRADRAVHS